MLRSRGTPCQHQVAPRRRLAAWGVWSCLAALAFGVCVLLLPGLTVAASGPAVTLAKSASPTNVVAGGVVTYTITLANSGDEAAQGVRVTDTLPAGFTYRPGSSRVTINGASVSTADPSRSGSTLTWSGFQLPSGRSASFYGMHTFVQRRTDDQTIRNQLDWSLQLMEPGAYVTQLFDGIEVSSGATPDWVRHYVDWAYDRGLIPVIRLAGTNAGGVWIKPQRDADGSYATIAQAFARMVRDIPRRSGHELYIQIWNEPNLSLEWGGETPNPTEFGQFFVQTASAIRALGYAEVKILNAPLSPGGNYPYLSFLEDMLNRVPDARWAFDVWASHPYPGNRPPSYNLHEKADADNYAAIDLYQCELEVLARHGRNGVKVLLTETGYPLESKYDVSFPAIGEDNRASYMVQAFRDYWRLWPEVIGVCPYELVDPEGNRDWLPWDWLWKDGHTHKQYDDVKALAKSYAPVSSVLRITFQVNAAATPGVYRNSVTATANNASIAPASNVAPVTVLAPTPTRTATRTPTATVTSTPEQTDTPMPTTTETSMPDETPAETATHTPTEAATPTCTATPEPSPTPTETSIVTSTPTPTTSPTVTSTPTQTSTPTPTATSTPECTDLIRNGGFEADEAWHTPQTTYPAGYSTARTHTGLRSMRLGMQPDDNVYSYSTAWQALHVPVGAHDVVLSFWYYPISTDIVRDYQYALVLDEHGTILSWMLNVRSNAQAWTRKEFALDAYAGQDIRISFGVYNDGGGSGATTMYVDDVSVPTCAATPTPTLPPITPSAWLYLPVILRPSGVEEARPQPALTQQGEVLGLPSVVRTLWQSQAGDARPDFIQGIALNPANDVLYLAAGQALWALDANTGRILAQIALNATPRGLAVDVARNRVYVALWDANALAVIDDAKNTLLRSVPDIPGASGVAVAQGRVYVTATRGDELIVVDAQNDAIIQRIPVGQAPYGVACDYNDPWRVFVTNAGEDSVSILDGRSGATLHTVHLGGLGHPQGLAFDAVRDRLYVAYTLAPRYGAIAALDASTGQILSRLTGNLTRPLFGAYGVAADPLRGWVHLSTVTGTYVLAGETLRILQEVPGMGPAYAFGMALDTAGGRLFLADGRQQRLAICSP